MSFLSELTALISAVVPVETGVFSGAAPDEYAVITPLDDIFELFGDNQPGCETREARISLYSKNNYETLKKRVTAAVLADGFTVTARRYIERENETGYFHYAVDLSKVYPASFDGGDETGG